MGELPGALLNAVGQAFIIEGEASHAIGRVFAKGLNCQADGRIACNSCLSCRIFESGNHPDIQYVKGSKSIGVDDVREQIVAPMMSKPHSYKYKIFIVDKAQTLTPAAQNALLKTIEESASYGVFLFLAAHTHTMLPTLLSRCVLVKLQEDAKKKPPIEIQAMAEEIAEGVAKMDILETMSLYRRIEPYKENKESVSQLLDMLSLAYSKKITKAITSGNTPHKLWFDSLAAIRHTKRVLDRYGNFQLAIELMLLKLNNI